MAEVIDIYDQWDLDNIVKSQLQYAVRLNTENFEIDLVYYDTGRQVNSEGELIFIQEQQITVDETVIHELTQNNSERTISSDQEKMDVIYELLYNYLQELGFSIAKESVYGSLFLCLEISLNDAKKCLFDMRNQN